MSIEKMPLFRKFPAEKGQSRLVMWIENKIYKIISRRINWLLDRITSDGIELIPEGSEPGDDGNWRIIIIGTDLHFQRRVSGSWSDGPKMDGV